MIFKHISYNDQNLSAVVQTHFFIKYKLYPSQCFDTDFFFLNVNIRIYIAFYSLVCSLTGEIQCFTENF